MKRYFRKQMYLFSLVLFCILTIDGCQNYKEIIHREDVFDCSSEEKNAEKTDEGSNEGLISVKASVKDEKNFYEYQGDDVVIPYQYMAKGADSVGVMVLCDGIATPFHTKENSKNQIIQTINLDEGSQKEINLCFIPRGKKGKTVSVEIVDIIEPDYDVTEGDSSAIINDYIQGRKYEVKYLSGIYITMKKDGRMEKKSLCKKYTQMIIPDKDKKNNSMFDPENLKSLNAIGKINNTQSIWYKTKQGQKLDIEIRYFGKVSGTILTSVFVDGKLYSAFQGEKYVQCPVDEKKYTIVKGQIDTSDLEKGRHTVFGVCGNVAYNDATCIPSFVIEVK